MSRLSYRHPPIIEAVIDLRLGDPLAPDILEKAQELIVRDYPGVEVRNELEIDHGPQGLRIRQAASGVNLVNADHTEMVILRPQGIATSRLAPYLGWDQFCEAARKNWQTFRRATGYRRLSRAAVRYINRIDVPVESGRIDTFEYLTIGPRHHFGTEPGVRQYSVQIVAGLPDGHGTVTVNTGLMTESPLLHHVSLLLDIDVYREKDAPQKDVDIWGLMNTLRDVKNRIFETSITDGARELFNRDR